MEFNTPTTKEELYQTLRKIFYYYRLQNPQYTEVLLDFANLSKISVEEISDEDLLLKAKQALYPEQNKRLIELKREIFNRKSDLQLELLKIPERKENFIKEIQSDYISAIENLDKMAIKNGTGSSTIYVEKKMELLKEKELKISDLTAQMDAEEKAINKRLEELEDHYEELLQDYYELAEKEIKAKQNEYQYKHKSYLDGILKYNNTIEEKLISQQNSVIQLNANLKLKYTELASKGFSKDQLIDMGYYGDVIDCVRQYYDSLTPINAYSEISQDADLIQYLDDYYQTIVYMYKIRAE